MQKIVDINIEKKLMRRRMTTDHEEFMNSGKNKAADLAIYQRLISEVDFDSDKVKMLLTYISLPTEVDTHRIMELCYQKGIQIAIPKCRNNEMEFYIITAPEQVKKGYFGTYEPVDGCPKADTSLFKDSVCVVPALCYSKDKYRLGYGKGYYDRFLTRYDGLTVGVCYKNFLFDEIPTGKGDLSVERLITD